MTRTDDALGMGFASHALVAGLLQALKQKGLLSQADIDALFDNSLTVLETAVPDEHVVRSARLILGRLLA